MTTRKDLRERAEGLRENAERLRAEWIDTDERVDLLCNLVGQLAQTVAQSLDPLTRYPEPREVPCEVPCPLCDQPAEFDGEGVVCKSCSPVSVDETKGAEQ